MSILIKNGTVYDGTGQPPKKQNIVVRGKFITKVGNLEPNDIDLEIDAKEATITPGFIDINSSSDHHLDLVKNPDQENYLKQGVTTIVGGAEGISLAPIYENSLEPLKTRVGGTPKKANINWQSFKEFLSAIENRGLGVNFASLVGYSNIRRHISSNEPKDLTEKELNLSLEEIKKAIQAGALGVSINRRGVRSKGIPPEELKELARLTKNKNKLFATNLKSLSKPKAPLKEIIEITESTEANTEINGFLPTKPGAKEFQKAINTLKEKSAKLNIHFDLHPYQIMKVNGYDLLPEWAKHDSFEETLKLLRAGNHNRRLQEHLKSVVRKKLTLLHTPDNMTHLKGKTLKQIANKKSKTQVETLVSLLNTSEMKIFFLFENLNEKTLKECLKSPTSIITTKGLHLENERFKPLIKFMNRAPEKRMPREKAIKKITSLPAQKYNIPKRGKLKSDFFADINIFKNGKLQHVIVNGKPAIKKRENLNNKNGKIIRGK